MAGNVLVLDNGAYALKAGWASDPSPKVIPNCIAKVKSERRRPFIGDQLEDCKDYSGLFYILPYQKGFLVNWDIQRQIWDYLFKTKFGIKGFQDKSLVVTEPYFNFKSTQENMMEVLYEEYQFKSLLRTNPGQLSALRHRQQVNPESLCCLVVDSGYSFTHIIPYVKGKKQKRAIRRIDVGGKALTNHLKDVVSYRQLHVLDETYVMNQCKEDSCFVSIDLDNDLEECKKKPNTIVRDYVLPDYTQLKRGYIRDPNDSTLITDQQVIRMNNERIQIPEILFHPTDVGINQIGVSHAIHHSIESLPEEVRPHLYENIVLIGGNTCFPGYKERIESDLRSMANYLYEVNVYRPENPICDPWFGGQMIVNKKGPDFENLSISRKEYEEKGMQFCIEKFDV